MDAQEHLGMRSCRMHIAHTLHQWEIVSEFRCWSMEYGGWMLGNWDPQDNFGVHQSGAYWLGMKFIIRDAPG